MYAANAECDPATGETTVSWRVDNNGAAPVTITGNTEDVPLEPNPVPPFGAATATQRHRRPGNRSAGDEHGDDRRRWRSVIEESDDITAAACEGPEPPPDVTFTFNVTPSVTTAAVGETVEYTYCGQNTSTIPLEVVRLVDDRLGVVIELPRWRRSSLPGESICNTDLGAPVSYVVQESDAGSVIKNNAVVSVQTQEDEPREFQATAQSEVAVPLERAIVKSSRAPLAAAKNDTGTATARRCSDHPYTTALVDSSSIDNLFRGNGHRNPCGPVCVSWNCREPGATSSHRSPTMRATSMQV